MKDCFFCYQCRTHKKLSLLVARKGLRDICTVCSDRAKSNSAPKLEAARLTKSRRAAKYYTSEQFKAPEDH